MNLQKLNLGFSSRNILQLKVLGLIAATFGQLPVTESVVLPLLTGKLAMQAKFVSDEVDAHRLLVDVESGRSTANYINNQKIFTQGEPADKFFFVQKGLVALTVTFENGLQKTIGVVKQGHFFGESCFHDNPVRLASATAMGECRVTSVTRAAMFSAVNIRPNFSKLFVDYLADHNRWVKKHLLDNLAQQNEPAQRGKASVGDQLLV
jgi:CRP-like cAMP-binding protein